MKRRTVLTPLVAVAATVAAASPADTEHVIPKDTTKVIDIEEVVVIATPKENNRLRQQAVSATSFRRTT